MPLPVITVSQGGLPVVDATVANSGLPVVESTSGYGLAVTKVGPKGGTPVVYVPTSSGGGGTAPTLTSAVQTDANVAITLTFSSAIDPAFVPAPTDFLAIANFVGKAPLSVSITGSTVQLMFDAAYSASGITISYTPGTVPLRGTNGAFVAAFADYPVAAASAWTPASLATLKGWYKADALTGADNSAVASWPDASGLSNTATPTNGPTLQTAEQNSLNVVQFANASTQYFT